MKSEFGLQKGESQSESFERLEGQLGQLPETIQALINGLPSAEKEKFLQLFAKDEKKSLGKDGADELSWDEVVECIPQEKREQILISYLDHIWFIFKESPVGNKLYQSPKLELEYTIKFLDILWSNKGKVEKDMVFPLQEETLEQRLKLRDLTSSMDELKAELIKAKNLPGKPGQKIRDDIQSRAGKLGLFFRELNPPKHGVRGAVWEPLLRPLSYGRGQYEETINLLRELGIAQWDLEKIFKRVRPLIEYFDANDLATLGLEFFQRFSRNRTPEISDEASRKITLWAQQHSADEQTKKTGQSNLNPKRRGIVLDNAYALARSALVIKNDPERQGSIQPTLNQLEVALRLLVN